jgi:phosphoglycerate dehydrogenase-like enzyme
MPDSPSILVTLPAPLYRALFSSDADAALRALGTVWFNHGERDWTAVELAERVAGMDACATGWGSACFDEQVLERADRLRIITHTGGAVKDFCPPAVFERGIVVTQAASALAPAVAEHSLLLAMLCLRRVYCIDLASPAWFDSTAPEYGPGDEISGRHVGIVGASWAGKAAIRLFRAVGADVSAYDPYLSREEAAKLGVASVGLHELLSTCDVLSLHAPATPETRHLIGARELALLRDGAVLVNTARSWLVDPDALFAELRRGRFLAALDVFDDEPLPRDSPLRNLPNVVLTPHLGGTSAQARMRQGETAVAELERFFAGEPLRNRVTLEMLPLMA